MKENGTWVCGKTGQGIHSQKSDVSSTDLGYDAGTSIYVTHLRRERSGAALYQ